MARESGRTPPTVRLPHLPSWVPPERATGPPVDLYVQGKNDPSEVHYSDAYQHELYNCFFVTGLIAVVRAHGKGADEFVKNMIKDNKDGTYTVTFFDRQEPTGRLEVTVNTGFDPGGVKSDEPGERWSAVIEKAYIKAYGGDAAGGNCADVMERLTGLQGRVFALGEQPFVPPMLAHSPLTPLSLEALAVYRDKGYATTLMTFNKDTAGAQQDAYRSPVYTYKLVPGHAYVVTNVDLDKKTVTINNYAWPDSYRDDIVVPYDQLEKLFAQAQANPVKYESPPPGMPAYPVRPRP